MKPTEVWIERVSPHHCYLRLGPTVLVVVQFPKDSPFALAMKDAAQRFFDQEVAPSANRSDSLQMQSLTEGK